MNTLILHLNLRVLKTRKEISKQRERIDLKTAKEKRFQNNKREEISKQQKRRDSKTAKEKRSQNNKPDLRSSISSVKAVAVSVTCIYFVSLEYLHVLIDSVVNQRLFNIFLSRVLTYN